MGRSQLPPLRGLRVHGLASMAPGGKEAHTAQSALMRIVYIFTLTSAVYSLHVHIDGPLTLVYSRDPGGRPSSSPGGAEF